MAEHACTTPQQTKSSRRALLGGLALAPVAIAGVSAGVATAGPHPDGELLALVEEWQKQAAACDAANKIESDAEDRCVWPAPPEPLFAREGDSRLFWSRAPDMHRTGREWWSPQIEFFRSHRLIKEGFRHPDARDPNFEGRKKRAAEIVAAQDEWEVERERIAQESGFADAEANARRLYEANARLRARILEARASTLDGLLAKARVVRWCYTGTHEHFLAEIADDIEERGAGDHGISLSVVRDLICMSSRVDHA